MKKNPLLDNLRMSAKIANAQSVDDIPTIGLAFSLDLDRHAKVPLMAGPAVTVWCTSQGSEAVITLCIEPTKKDPNARMIDMLPVEAISLASLLSTLAHKIEELARGANPQTVKGS